MWPGTTGAGAAPSKSLILTAPRQTGTQELKRIIDRSFSSESLMAIVDSILRFHFFCDNLSERYTFWSVSDELRTEKMGL